MRVTHLCLACFYPDGFSYQENMLPKFHKQQGHEVQIIASLQNIDTKGRTVYYPQATSYLNEYGIPVTRLDYRSPVRLNKKLKRFRNLYETLEKSNCEVLFIHGCQFLDADIVVKYLRKHPDIRVYVDNHADLHNSAMNFVSKNILHRILWRRCARMLDPFVTKWYGVLPARVDFLHDVYGISKDRIELLVMGADDERVKAALQPAVRQTIRKQYGIREDDFLIITGGKIGHGKRRVIDLMDVVNHLPRDDVKLIVFGSVIPELAPLVQERCSDKVQYIGWVESAESSNYLAAADLAVYPGLHSVLWEQTVALGIPVICTRFPGMEHIDLGGNVRFIGAEGSEEIDRAIKDVLDGDRYLEMKRIAREKGIKTFSYSEIAARSIREEA